ncbi:MAG: hypothetical protein AAB518_04120 [Patescibacteria group bacterium]
MKKTISAIIFGYAAVSFFVLSVHAQVMPPPATSPAEPYISVSPDEFRTLEEVLYIVGRSDPKAIVTVTLTKQGEKPIKFTVPADSSGEWTITEKTYLSAGYWQVRAKQQIGTLISGESNPRVIRSVVNGVSIFGWNVRYVVIAGVLLFFLAVVTSLFVYFRKKIRTLQRGLLEKQLRETEDRFHRGFTEIRKDLMDQLRDLAAGTSGRPLTPDEVSKRDHILREIEEIEKNLEHDVADISKRY